MAGSLSAGHKHLNTQIKIWIALVVMIAFVIAGLWQLANARGVRARGRRRHAADPGDGTPAGSSQRRSDKRQLTSQEKKLFAESQRLLSQGKINAGARILEQLGMPREAVQALEDHGMIHEAARILMRMQRHNRAGVIYARHGMWEHASQSFRIANMPLEAAKCAREAGTMPLAAELFEKAERYEDAAECCVSFKDFLRASRLCHKAGNETLSLSFLDKAVLATENIETLQFDDSEINRILAHLGSGATGIGLARAASSRNRLGPAMMSLVSQGLVKQACDLYLIPSSDIGPSLMAEVSYHNRDAQTLAEVFMRVEKFHYAGMVFEKLGTFDLAGDAFERGGDLERAIYCYERGHLDDKVKLLKKGQRDQKLRSMVAKEDAAAPALLPAGTPRPVEAPEKEKFDEDEGGESTQVLSVGLHVQSAPGPKSPPGVQNASSLPPALKLKDAPAKSREKSAGVFSLGVAEDTVSDRPPAPMSTEEPTPSERGPDGEVLEIEAFERCRFLDDFSQEQKHLLWSLGQSLAVDAGAAILNFQESPVGLYVITQGTVTCHRMVGAQETYLESIGPGDSFGELWLLTDLPTTVSFRAKEAATLRVIPRNQFSSFLEKDGVIARKVYKRFTNRLLKSLLKSQQPPKNQAAS